MSIEKLMAMVKESISIKLIIIGVLLLILLIPMTMIENLIEEREGRKHDVINEISYKWGNEQTVTGPFLSVPYKTTTTDKNGRKRTKIEYAYCLPDNLNVIGEINPEIRYRGIYKAVLYNTNLEIKGDFASIKEKLIEINPEDILWDKTKMMIGITDIRGIKKSIDLTINKEKYSLSPGVDSCKLVKSGVHTKIKGTLTETISFDIKINLNGSHSMNFIPIGKNSSVSLTSSWESPSFSGAFLPLKRSISKDGFDAQWQVFELNRDFPQSIINNSYNLNDYSFGVKLFIATDIYQQSIRTVKYAILFIIFTFAAVFFSEVINKIQIHPIQYLVIGCAVSIFYVLLISISEHLNFGFAYILSSIAIISLIFGYIKSIFNKFVFPIIIAVIQIILYTYLYITLQSEDYALLMGSLGLLTVLGIVMYVTRNLNRTISEE